MSNDIKELSKSPFKDVDKYDKYFKKLQSIFDKHTNKPELEKQVGILGDIEDLSIKTKDAVEAHVYGSILKENEYLDYAELFFDKAEELGYNINESDDNTMLVNQITIYWKGLPANKLGHIGNFYVTPKVQKQIEEKFEGQISIDFYNEFVSVPVSRVSGYDEVINKMKNTEYGSINIKESLIIEANKIACIDCDEVNTKNAWKKNDGFCPSCKTSSQGVAEAVGTIDLPKEIAKDLLPELETKKETLGKFSVKDLEDIMLTKGADLQLLDETVSELVNMGFDFDTEEDDYTETNESKRSDRSMQKMLDASRHFVKDNKDELNVADLAKLILKRSPHLRGYREDAVEKAIQYLLDNGIDANVINKTSGGETNKTNESVRPATDIEKNVFVYLNDLRESGVTNMFGAVPYILDEFPELDKRKASDLLSTWMENFNDEGNYDMIKESLIPLNERVDTKDKAREIRNTLRREFPKFRFSVTSDIRSITVAIMKGPVDFLKDSTRDGHEQLNHYQIERRFAKHPEALDVLTKIKELIFNEQHEITYDGDYGSVPNYYGNIHIGKWDKPYVYTGEEKEESPIQKEIREKLDMTNENYKAYFKDKLDEFGVDTPTELTKDQWEEIDKGWTAEDETNYQTYFKNKLDEFGVDSPDKLTKDQWNEIDAEWESDKEDKEEDTESVSEDHLTCREDKIDLILFYMDDKDKTELEELSDEVIETIYKQVEKDYLGVEDDKSEIEYSDKIEIDDKIEESDENENYSIATMTFDEFKETVRPYEVEGGFGSTIEKGYEIAYVPKGHIFLGKKFKADTIEDAYEKYQSLERLYTESNSVEEKEKFVVIAKHKNGGGFILTKPVSKEEAENYKKEFPNNSKDIVSQQAVSVSKASEMKNLIGKEYLKENSTIKEGFESRVIVNDVNGLKDELLIYITNYLWKGGMPDELMERLEEYTGNLAFSLDDYKVETDGEAMMELSGMLVMREENLAKHIQSVIIKNKHLFEYSESVNEDKSDYIYYDLNKAPDNIINTLYELNSRFPLHRDDEDTIINIVKHSDGAIELIDKDKKYSLILEKTGDKELLLWEFFTNMYKQYENVNENLRSVTVKYADGTEISTSMAGHLTDDEIRNYFAVGKEFNVGSYGKDNVQPVEEVIINENNNDIMYKCNNCDGAFEEEDLEVVGSDKNPEFKCPLCGELNNIKEIEPLTDSKVNEDGSEFVDQYINRVGGAGMLAKPKYEEGDIVLVSVYDDETGETTEEKMTIMDVIAHKAPKGKFEYMYHTVEYGNKVLWPEEDIIKKIDTLATVEENVNETHKQVMPYKDNTMPWIIYPDSIEAPEKTLNYNAVQNMIMQDSFLSYAYDNIMTGNFYEDMEKMYKDYIEKDTDSVNKLKTFESYTKYAIDETINKSKLANTILENISVEITDDIKAEIYNNLSKITEYKNGIKNNLSVSTLEFKNDMKVFKDLNIKETLNAFKDSNITLESFEHDNVLEFNKNATMSLKTVLEGISALYNTEDLSVNSELAVVTSLVLLQ